MSALGDIGDQVLAMEAFSIEYEEQGQFIYVHIQFWKGEDLCKVKLCRFGQTVPFPTGHIGALSRVMSAITKRPNLVSCSGCPQDILRSLDKSSLFNRGIQQSFRFSELDLARLMHRDMYSVFGRIDFFSVLEHLILSLSGSLTERWTLDAPELVKVSIGRFCPMDV